MVKLYHDIYLLCFFFVNVSLSSAWPASCCPHFRSHFIQWGRTIDFILNYCPSQHLRVDITVLEDFVCDNYLTVCKPSASSWAGSKESKKTDLLRKTQMYLLKPIRCFNEWKKKSKDFHHWVTQTCLRIKEKWGFGGSCLSTNKATGPKITCSREEIWYYFSILLVFVSVLCLYCRYVYYPVVKISTKSNRKYIAGEDRGYKSMGTRRDETQPMEYHNCYPTSIAFLCDNILLWLSFSLNLIV